jgi:hypothetical protein
MEAVEASVPQKTALPSSMRRMAFRRSPRGDDPELVSCLRIEDGGSDNTSSCRLSEAMAA